MVRPLAKQKSARVKSEWRHLLIDGYVDEPAALGVPPFLSPQVRSLAGGLVSAGVEEDGIGYMTIDQWRDLKGSREGEAPDLNGLDSLVLIAGCVVPGKYLRGTPVSPREAYEIFSISDASVKVITGSASESMSSVHAEVHSDDTGLLGEDIGSSGRIVDRKAGIDDWNHHLRVGAFIAEMHPDAGGPLICEIETSRGCPRYISGGCSFCMEPSRGPLLFREPEDVADEVGRLGRHGVENIRIGGQSDLMSYLSGDVGRSEVPEPDPEMLSELFKGVRSALYEEKGLEYGIGKGRRPGIDTGIIHTDNANPSVISEYPESSLKALSCISENITSGSVLAFGLESSDPGVREINNLNSTPEQVLDAVRIMNRVGRAYGKNGMPILLPGINFLGGLPGQEETSFDHDIELLDNIVQEDLLIRRINIRKAVFPGEKKAVNRNLDETFKNFKQTVRERFDRVFLQRMLPEGHVIRGVHMEASSGHVSFGRQIGSYPILVGVGHGVDLESWIDIAITKVSSRSVSGFSTPFDLKTAGYRDLISIPGIGKKRAASIFTKMGRKELRENDIAELGWVRDHLVL